VDEASCSYNIGGIFCNVNGRITLNNITIDTDGTDGLFHRGIAVGNDNLVNGNIIKITRDAIDATDTVRGISISSGDRNNVTGNQIILDGLGRDWAFYLQNNSDYNNIADNNYTATTEYVELTGSTNNTFSNKVVV